MASLSLLTGPTALLVLVASASAMFTPATAAATTATAEPTKAAPADPSATSSATAQADMDYSPTATLVYRCHQSLTENAGACAATVAKSIAQVVQHIGCLLLVFGALCLAAASTCCRMLWQTCWWHLWECKSATRLRKKLYVEIALATLSPGGNGFILLLLWPGWLVLAAAAWGLPVAWGAVWAASHQD